MTQSSKGPASGTGGAYGFLRKGYDPAHGPDLSTADLESATVYGHANETIGSISRLQIDAAGRITAAVIEVGGFLGIGAHAVLLPFGDLTVLRRADGADISVYLDTTREKLKAMPHHTS